MSRKRSWLRRLGRGASTTGAEATIKELRTAGDRFSLTLARVQPFESGNVLLTYQPATP